MKDFAWYKQNFANKQREIKDLLKRFARMEEASANDDGTVLGRFNQMSDEINLQIDELEEILKELAQLQHLQPNERSVQLRLKNQLKELQNEYSQIKKLVKNQFKLNQIKQPGRSTANLSNRRMRGFAQESQGIDRTLDLTNEIMSVGSAASNLLDGQTNRLRNANSNLNKLEMSTAPGAEKLIGAINKAERKNTIIIAFVISVCLVITLYSLGVIDLLKMIFKSAPKEVVAGNSAVQPLDQIKSEVEIAEVDHVEHSDHIIEDKDIPYRRQNAFILEPEDEGLLDDSIDGFLGDIDWDALEADYGEDDFFDYEDNDYYQEDDFNPI